MEITPKQHAQWGKKIKHSQLQTLKKIQIQCDFFHHNRPLVFSSLFTELVNVGTSLHIAENAICNGEW